MIKGASPGALLSSWEVEVPRKKGERDASPEEHIDLNAPGADEYSIKGAFFKNMPRPCAICAVLRDAGGSVRDYRFLDINLALTEMTGIDKKKLLGRTGEEAASLLGVYMKRTFRKALLSEGCCSFENFISPPRKYFEVKSFDITPEQRAVVFNEITDIKLTGQIEYTKSLSSHHELLRKIFDNIPVMLVLWDPELKRFTLNRYSENTLGWSNHEVNRTDFMANVYPDEIQRKEVSEFMQNLSPGWREFDLRAKDGSKVPSRWSNVRLSDDTMVGIGIDLRQQREMERLLKENEVFSDNILTSSLNGFYIYDLPEQKHILINSEYTNLTGYTPEFFKRLSGRGFLNLFHPEDREKVFSHLEDLKGTKEGDVREFEYRFRRSDGKMIWCQSRDSVFSRDPDGSVRRVIGSFLDISGRKEAEEVLKRDKEMLKSLVREQSAELLETQKRLEDARRLSDIGTLAATVAHELRNPLAAINMAGYNIERKIGSDKISRNLRSIKQKVNESEKIIENLLFYSKLRPPQYEKVRLYDIVNESIRENRVYPAKEVCFSLDGMERLRQIIIEADSHQIKEVLVNIIANAIDAIDEHGMITLRGRIKKDRAELSVSDDGCGIEEEHLNRIFDPFYTTKARGTGLGLTVCRQIITLHKGTMDIKSRKGKGTVVDLSVPLRRRGR
jgi:PAS domain S-box-containing protein